MLFFWQKKTENETPRGDSKWGKWSGKTKQAKGIKLQIKFWFFKRVSTDVSWRSNILPFFLWLISSSGNVISRTTKKEQKKRRNTSKKGYSLHIKRSRKGNNQMGGRDKGVMQLMRVFYCHIPTGCLFWMCSALSRKGTQRATLSEGHIYIETWWKDSVTSTETMRQTHFLNQKVRSSSGLAVLHTSYWFEKKKNTDGSYDWCVLLNKYHI